jgi:hypothetical protein
MKYILILFFALMLGSCDPAPQRGADGYVFGSKQFYKETVQVKVITYSKADFERQLVKYKLPKTTAAFTQLVYPYDTCTIHMIDPSIRYEPEFVGHEFLHCVYGQWHTDNESKS